MKDENVIQSSMVNVDGEEAMTSGSADGPIGTRRAGPDEDISEESEEGIGEYRIGLIAKYSESAMNGILSSNVMRYASLSEMEEDAEKIIKVATTIGSKMAEEVLK